MEEFDLPDDAQHILRDERIAVIYTHDKIEITQQMRRVAVYSEKYQKVFVYITNNFELSALEIAMIYANRWQIETFFKTLKQNFPLTYFFGDNENAIEIQVWCALIALLLLDVLHKGQKSNMTFSVFAAIIHLHIMNYVSISEIIKAYKTKRHRKKKEENQKPPPKKTAYPAFQTKLEM